MIQERAKEYKRYSESRRGQNEVVWNGHTVPTPMVWTSSMVDFTNDTRYKITNAVTVTAPSTNINTTTHFK